LGYLQKANGSWSDSSKESLDLLLDAHFPGSQQTGERIELDRITLIAFLDIEGAFNNVLPTAITESLTELRVEPPMVGLIHKLLISRMVTATLGTSTQTRLVNKGTP